MFHSSPAAWLALLFVVAVPAAQAQTQDAPPAHHHSQHDHQNHQNHEAHRNHAGDRAQPAAAALPYKSAFDSYRPFADEEPVPWQQANQAVAPKGDDPKDPHVGHSMPMKPTPTPTPTPATKPHGAHP